MQELSDSIKRPNLTIMISEGEEVQSKGIHNILKINNIKFSKSQVSFAQSGIGSLQDTKNT
jgi:hypothetical protein